MSGYWVVEQHGRLQGITTVSDNDNRRAVLLRLIGRLKDDGKLEPGYCDGYFYTTYGALSSDVGRDCPEQHEIEIA